MKRQLLLVTEIEFTDSERVTRLEFLSGDDYSAEEWTRAHQGGVWRPTKTRWRDTESITVCWPTCGSASSLVC